MNWFLGVLIVLVVVFLTNSIRVKKRRLKKLNQFKSNWGKAKNVDEFHFNSIEKYFNNTNDKDQAFHIISNRCAADLDINDVFEVIDRTASKIGQQYLYYKLRTIESQSRLLAFNDLTLLFEGNESLRLKIQLELTKINTNDSYYFEELVTSKPLKKPKHIGLIYALSILSFFLSILGFFFPIFFIVLIPIFAINMVFHYKNKWNISNYIDGISQLSKTIQVAKNITVFPEIKKKFTDTRFIKNVERIKLKSAFISFDKDLGNEFAIVFWLVSEFIKVLFNLEYLIFYSFTDAIANKRAELKQMFHFIGEIDAAISTASLKASDHNICNPIFTYEKRMAFTEISHPLIANCVVNNLTLVNHSLLLTGSNMSGKTTFIRSIAINSILAQSLNVCFAKSYTAPFFKVYSSIRISDDVLQNTSYYLEEVLTIKKLVETSQSDQPCLFVLDEIFKGTNTVERISGGKAILSYLNKGNNMVLVSTHDIELTDMLSKNKFNLYHFSEQIASNELRFDHKLKAGKLKSRNAIRILELYDYPSEIINDAKATESATFGPSPNT